MYKTIIQISLHYALLKRVVLTRLSNSFCLNHLILKIKLERSVFPMISYQGVKNSLKNTKTFFQATLSFNI